jgi:hypothetical protein
MKNLSSYLNEGKNPETLVISFKNQSDYMKAVQHFESKSDYTLDEVNNRVREIYFTYEDGLEYYLQMDLEDAGINVRNFSFQEK